MSIKRNIIANYIGTGVAVLAPILALPWYLSELGSKQFGLIGFIAMLQAVLGMLDAGMGQALVREISLRFNATDQGRDRAASLLFGFERIYWGIAFFVGVGGAVFADTFASHWLNLEGLPVATGRNAIYGAAAIFAAQFPGSIYRSLLVGAQAQVALNAVISGGTLIRHFGGVIVVFLWPTFSAYIIWHACAALLETLIRCNLAWRVLGVKRGQVIWDKQEFQEVWRVIASMSGVALLGALTVQMDKIILSRMVSIEQFGYYTVAATVAAGLLQLIGPLVQAVMPRAILLRAAPIALRALYVKLSIFILVMTSLVIVIFLLVGKWLLTIWLRNPQAAEVIYPLLTVLLVGTCCNYLYNVGYLNWIVKKRIHRMLLVNTLALVLSVLLIPPLVAWQGPIGATFGWLSINFIGLLISLEWLKKTDE
ncbi:hypothetical protein B9Z35_09210 [Limnohabitans sp. Jir61]|uniref:lipopolysaccharide biosynthesis protein n=1 Tax=Limnohabitans sp. Jir61 TaxID=1826168 RepID=UPI000D3C6553|nr:oligosaccharide flippase family protein [Limnohabitans sp. Jir61]PUE31191.1 hypothetical protein B9Z35_09210 [Limnohabitans sp. Jir61]